MRRLFIPISFASIFLLTFSCRNSDCTCTDPVLSISDPGTGVYRSELARQLQATDPATLTFWFTGYSVTNGTEYLHFRVKGKTLCAEMRLTVEDWTLLKDLRERKGESYRGAEFVNLQYEIRRDSTGTGFVFRRFDKIID